MNEEEFDEEKFEKEWGNEPTPLPLNGLIYYLEYGREIEFSYRGQSYFIDHSSKEGRTVWIDQTAVSEAYNDDFIENLDKIFLQGKSLTDIFRDEEGLIEFLY
ncbi:hypothetical protein VXN63_08460 [Marinilactibacillus sp. XAAS-LB27]|uniref:hypothetical protein n=1 Tax=Marinilactibacillus sp. XAAS-LB27 TaxID=3114538 RepID=UPI002E16CA1F|nr:hypothetical protein [Marinilactibacillus sp. XAAS-LB27]